MADQIQNVRIRYTVEGNLNQAKNDLSNLTKEERDLVEAFRAANSEAKKANDTIQRESKESQKAVKGTKDEFNALGQAGTKLVGVMAGVFAVDRMISFGEQVVAITGEFQKFSAVLTNTLGSESAALGVLSSIQSFAATTPFVVRELTESYVKLANQGFRPTTQELRKLGDLAASTGKSFDQLTEAIIDAQTGEFERLKEFGIRASKEGDKVTFAFKGVQTQVDFTNDSIRNYVLSLGDLEGVTGSMAAISQTLEGQISNLGDSWDKLLLTIGGSTDSVFSGAISMLNEFLATLTDILETQEQIDQRVRGQAFTRANQEMANSLKGLNEEAARMVVQERLAQLNESLEQSKKNIAESEEQLKDELFPSLSEWSDFLELNQQTLKFTSAEIEGVNIALEDHIKALKAAEDQAKKEAEERKKREEERAKEYEKLFKSRLDQLKQLEDLAVRQAKLDNQNEGDIFKIREDFAQRRIQLAEQYGKREELIYQDFILQKKEAEKGFTDYLDAEHKKRLDSEKLMEDEATKKKKEELEKRLEESRKYAKEYAAAMVKADEEAAERRKRIQQESYNFLGELIYASGEIRQNQIASEIEMLQHQRESDLKGYAENEQAKGFINAKFDAEERRLKREMAIAEKNNALFQIAITTAQKIIQAYPVVPLMALAGATGAAQAAIVSSRPIPRYNKGTKSVPGVDTGDDSVLAMVRPGEGILPVDKNRQYGPSFAAMFDGTVPPSVLNKFVIDYQRLKGQMPSDGGIDYGIRDELKGLRRDLKNQQKVDINIDKNGIKTLIKSGQSETEFLNNYFRN